MLAEKILRKTWKKWQNMFEYGAKWPNLVLALLLLNHHVLWIESKSSFPAQALVRAFLFLGNV